MLESTLKCDFCGQSIYLIGGKMDVKASLCIEHYNGYENKKYDVCDKCLHRMLFSLENKEILNKHFKETIKKHDQAQADYYQRRKEQDAEAWRDKKKRLEEKAAKYSQ